MNSEVLLIVLTDNSWLYAGLAALQPEMVCLQAGFSAHRLPREVRYARHVIIAVDSRILFRGGACLTPFGPGGQTPRRSG